MKSDYTQFVLSRLAVTCIIAVGWAHAQGTTPKEKPSDYPVRVQLPGLQIAAEYLVHSVPVDGGVLTVNDYLVLEIALYPEKPGSVLVASGDFTLKINNRKEVLFAQVPGMVAASIKYPDWESRPTLEATAGVGDAGIVLGRPRTVSRFPGDPRPDQSRLPRQPRVPDQTSPVGQENPITEPVDVSIARSALPEGLTKGPVSGYLFFAFKGKTKSIRSLEVLYSSPDGSRAATLRLF